jgi:copper chaperone CopZ
MEKITIPVKGMHCASCAHVIKKSISKIDGVSSIEVNPGTEKAYIEYDKDKTNIHNMSESIKPLGYELMDNAPMPASHGNMSADEHAKHLGLNQTKEEKLKELSIERKKVLFVLPLAIVVFVFMFWEIGSKSFPSSIPAFFIPMEIYSVIMLILSSIRLIKMEISSGVSP